MKRKLEAAKEEKRRQEILARRRVQQNEATERFQRLGKPREQLLGECMKIIVNPYKNNQPRLIRSKMCGIFWMNSEG